MPRQLKWAAPVTVELYFCACTELEIGGRLLYLFNAQALYCASLAVLKNNEVICSPIAIAS